MSHPYITIRCPAKGTAVVGLSREESPTLTGGFGGWERIPRPRRVALTDHTGSEPYTQKIALRFDGWSEQASVEADIAKLTAMAVGREFGASPPIVRVKGPVLGDRIDWVIEDLEFGESLWNAKGRIRQDVTVSLLEYVKPDVVKLSPAARRRVIAAAAPSRKAKAKAKVKNTRGTNRGR